MLNWESVLKWRQKPQATKLTKTFVCVLESRGSAEAVGQAGKSPRFDELKKSTKINHASYSDFVSDYIMDGNMSFHLLLVITSNFFHLTRMASTTQR